VSRRKRPLGELHKMLNEARFQITPDGMLQVDGDAPSAPPNPLSDVVAEVRKLGPRVQPIADARNAILDLRRDIRVSLTMQDLDRLDQKLANAENAAISPTRRPHTPG
jgi:hypothetical protein